MSHSTDSPDASDPVLAQLQAEGWTHMPDAGFIGYVGPFWFKRVDGACRLRWPTGARHVNRNGVVQGGALMTFADRSCGVAVRDNQEDVRTATVHMDTHFVAPVRIGDLVEARPQVLRTEGRTVFVRNELFVGERLVAFTDGVWTLLKGKP